MLKNKKKKLKEKVISNIIINPLLKVQILDNLANWSDEKVGECLAYLENLNNKLAKKLTESLQDPKKRAKVFHELSKAKVKLNLKLKNDET